MTNNSTIYLINNNNYNAVHSLDIFNLIEFFIIPCHHMIEKIFSRSKEVCDIRSKRDKRGAFHLSFTRFDFEKIPFPFFISIETVEWFDVFFENALWQRITTKLSDFIQRWWQTIRVSCWVKIIKDYENFWMVTMTMEAAALFCWHYGIKLCQKDLQKH